MRVRLLQRASTFLDKARQQKLKCVFSGAWAIDLDMRVQGVRSATLKVLTFVHARPHKKMQNVETSARVLVASLYDVPRLRYRP